MRPSLVLRAGARTTPGLDKARRASRAAIFPLAKELARNDTRTGAAATRADIVSPDLCDDVLSSIGPSLEPYKHCDIIDVNPGAGLWSSKLHDFLKPRRHILAEPDAFYTPFLQLLLDQPDSTYVFGPTQESVIAALVHTLRNGLLPDQQALDRQDPRLNQTNKSLLLLLNLTRFKAASSRKNYFFVRETLNILTNTAWTHTGIHKYGQVRMLVWLGEYFEDRFVPKELNQVDPHGFSFQFRTQTNVVASPDRPRLPREESTLELSSAIRAIERMRKVGLELPPNRQNWMHQKAMSVLEKRSVEDVEAELKSGIITNHFANDEITDIEHSLQSGVLKDPLAKPWRNRLAELKENAQHSRYSRSRDHGLLLPIWALADKHRQLELTVVDETRPAQERLSAKEEMEKLRMELKKQARKMNKLRRHIFYKIIDERRAYYSDPPALSWDTRPFEPLRTDLHEFFPQQNLSLLDITPKPAPRNYTYEDLSYWQRFSDRMYERTTATVGKALDSMRMGSAEIILPQVGSICDPRRGGSLDIEEMRVRSLTPEMMDEIVNAWRNWDFRPETLEKYFTDFRLEWYEMVGGEGNKNDLNVLFS